MAEKPRASWTRRLWTLLAVIFCFEIGVFLLVFPWLEPWQHNWAPNAIPLLRSVWESPYFRGALSGLGALDIYISFLEILRLRRLSL